MPQKRKSLLRGEQAGNSLLQKEFTTRLDETQAPARLDECARRECLRLAVMPSDNTEKKRRIMDLWEHGIITDPEAVRLISQYQLQGD